MTPEQQVKAWVEGNPKCPNDNGECCPDFSCCQPHLLSPEPERIAFAEGDSDLRNKMLPGFLGRAFATLGKKVHIAGEGGDEH